LREEIEKDLKSDRVPCCVCGAAGATSTGVVDDLAALAQVARSYNVWFHVDAAYGGALSFSGKHKHELHGIEKADSITIDPHKWMFIPIACGAVLVRDGPSVLREAFDITPEYLSEERKEMGRADVDYDLFRYGQLGSQRFNALKIWMALKFLGVQGYAEIIERQIGLARYLAERIESLPDFQRLGEVQTAVCCFRFVPEKLKDQAGELDRLQMALQQRIEHSGEAWFATTVLHGRRALRVNVNSFLTERRHIDDLVELLVRESSYLVKVL
jgi:glutamate/tyrosine decarboxylase-like PLP-dependent enzyme